MVDTDYRPVIGGAPLVLISLQCTWHVRPINSWIWHS